MKLFTLSVFIFFQIPFGISQTIIYGEVNNIESGEEISYARLALSKNGVFAGGLISDFDGKFYTPIKSGTYDLKISYKDYPDHLITDINIIEGQKIELNIKLISFSEEPLIVKRHTPNTIDPNVEDLTDLLSYQPVRSLPSKDISALKLATTVCHFGLGTIDIEEVIAKNKISAIYVDGVRHELTAHFVKSRPFFKNQNSAENISYTDLTFMERYNLRD